VVARHLREADAQLCAAVPIENHFFGRVGGVLDQFHGHLVKLGIPAPMKRRQRLEARNRQDPSRNLRTTFEAINLAPDIDEDLASEVLGSAGVGDQAGR
jgi:hypothetical protein